MKPYSVVVTGEPTYIKRLIGVISYGPEKIITHKYRVKDTGEAQQVAMSFGSLQVDEDHRIDFFGGNDQALFEFIDQRPDDGFKGLIITINTDDESGLENVNEQLLTHIEFLNKHALVIGVAGADYIKIKQAEEQVRQSLIELNKVAPVFSFDPDNKEDVSLLVESLLCFADPGISDYSRGKSTFELIEEVE